MYKTEKKVIEDMIVSGSCLEQKHTFTGGKNKLELPYTISFLSEGEYRVSIDSGTVNVTKVN